MQQRSTLNIFLILSHSAECLDVYAADSLNWKNFLGNCSICFNANFDLELLATDAARKKLHFEENATRT
jgi:hypothetical protein